MAPEKSESRIVSVGQFEKLDLHFDDGDRLSLNATNVKTP